MRSFLCTLLFGFLVIAPAVEARSGKPFAKLASCRLVSNSSNDGDSFHVRWKGDEYIFRLYFVDTPETGNEFPARVKEQAKYFGITSDQVIEIGKTASAFTRSKLAGKSFTIYTHWQNAMGQSRLPRYYGFVIVEDQNLSELLIANGLARIYGMEVYAPDGTSPSAFEAHLRVLESRAKAEHLGAWSLRTPQPKKPDDSWDKVFKNRPVAAPQ